MSFWSELRRRHVVRVGVTYGVVGFAAVQAADVLFPRMALPEWTVALVVGLAVVGFPVAVGLAWAFDLTPAGVKRTEPLPPPAPPPALTAAGAGPAAPAPAAESAPRAFVPPASPASGDGRTGVAVLPLANLSGDPANDYFSDGVTEDILLRLARVRRLRVTSRTSVMQYKGSAKNIRQIASELGVDAVLEGSIRVAGGRVRVVAQLIDAATDGHLWAESYDRDLEDIFAVQSEVAEEIAGALRAELAPDEVSRLRGAPTASLEAYELALKARKQYSEVFDYRRSLELYERALALDPDFALAHAHLAMMLSTGVYYSQMNPHDVFPRVRQAVARALALDPDLPEAHVAKAWLSFHYDWDWAGVDASLEHALELNPNAVDALFLRGAHSVSRERFEEGLDWIRRGLRVDPRAPFLQSHLAQYTLYAGRPEEAERLGRDAVRHAPDSPHAHFALGYALDALGRYLEAADEFGKAAKLSTEVALWRTLQGVSLHRGGRTEEAAALIEGVESQARREYVDGVLLSSFALLRGDVESAIDRLERAYDERAFLLLWLRAIPRYRSLRSHPRFMALLRRIWPDDHIEA